MRDDADQLDARYPVNLLSNSERGLAWRYSEAIAVDVDLEQHGDLPVGSLPYPTDGLGAVDAVDDAADVRPRVKGMQRL